MNELIIDTITIRKDSEGRYCLNDLHKAAGGEDKHKPANWLRNQQTQDLVEALYISLYSGVEDCDSYIENLFKVEKGGALRGGSWVHPILFLDYARWLSPSLYVSVITAYHSAIDSNVFLKIPSIIKQDNSDRKYFIYAMSDVDSSLIKIGISRNPIQRLKNLNNNIGVSSLKLIKTVSIPSNVASFAEQIALNITPCHVKGEWFNCSEDDAISSLDLIENMFLTNIQDQSKIKKPLDTHLNPVVT
jgi:hypothetical protein